MRISCGQSTMIKARTTTVSELRGLSSERQNALENPFTAQQAQKRGSCVMNRRGRSCLLDTEVEFGCDLQTPGSAIAEERVADSDVTGYAQRQKPSCGTRWIESVRCALREEVGEIRIGKIRMVKEVVSLKT